MEYFKYKFNEKWCTVYTEDGMHMVVTPDGIKIPAVITTITNDSTGTNPQCTLTIHCNIAKDINEAQILYKIKQ